MKQSEAEARIKLRFLDWLEEEGLQIPVNGNKAFKFYGHLLSNHSDLLEFSYQGDKWQPIHGWLERAGLVSDPIGPPRDRRLIKPQSPSS